jgi:hypothetical protein
MLSRERLARDVVRLRSERPADWRDELDALDTTPDTGRRAGGKPVVERTRRLKYATVSELSALEVLLEERPTGDRATFHDAVWRRIALRRRLRLTNDSCYGQPANAACSCGAEGLDALTDAELEPLNIMQARSRILVLAKERHQREPRPRKLKPNAAALPPETAATPQAPTVSAEALSSEPEPTPNPAPRWRRNREPLDPNSWAAFKRGRDGAPMTADEISRHEF